MWTSCEGASCLNLSNCAVLLHILLYIVSLKTIRILLYIQPNLKTPSISSYIFNLSIFSKRVFPKEMVFYCHLFFYLKICRLNWSDPAFFIQPFHKWKSFKWLRKTYVPQVSLPFLLWVIRITDQNLWKRKSQDPGILDPSKDSHWSHFSLFLGEK